MNKLKKIFSYSRAPLNFFPLAGAPSEISRNKMIGNDPDAPELVLRTG